MKKTLLQYIQCLSCGSSFEVLASEPVSGEEIKKGILFCQECGQWYPIQNSVPEIYPDCLRIKKNELRFLSSLKSYLKPGKFMSLKQKIQSNLLDSPQSQDPGAKHKQAEMTIETKVEDESFFGPGYLSPFNPGYSELSWQLIRRLGNAIPLLELKPGSVIADIGAGYAWTAEWLMKMGFTVIGVDICRIYFDIGLQRMKTQTPHLILADVENSPLKAKCIDAVLCFDAFHHIYDRKKAMSHFWRILKKGGNVTLAEPGPEHELLEPSKEVMKKFGILEKGMSLDDLKEYCKGLDFLDPEEHFILDVPSNEKKKFLTKKFIKSHIYADCHFYRIKKPS
ncbi:MAG: methyltransferase domain-containing protein [Candidatus Aminicenantes bacterium]|nr:methyltransferase domain-containing protein [Candidatus Aminicenantes bacterium]